MAAMAALAALASVVGSGPDVALIHGWGLGSWVWQPLLGPLSQSCRVHLVDLPGYGRPAAGEKGQDFAATAQAVLDSLPARVSLCGWSLGGMLAMRAALLAPERICGLVLVGSTPCFTQRADWLSAQLPELLDGFSRSIRNQPEQTLQRFAALLNQGDCSAREITRKLLDGLRQHPPPEASALRSGLDWLRAVDLRSQLAAITCPSLLIHGSNDPLNPLSAARWLGERLANAQLEVFENSGHAPFLANPDRFTRLLDDFCHATAAA